LVTASFATVAQAQSVHPSPGWMRAMPPGPDTRVKITEEYARQVGRHAYFWAWPMVNIYNRRLAFSQVREAMKTGPLIQSPVNQIAMLTDYVDPEERSVACPNQDVVYGIGSLALDLSQRSAGAQGLTEGQRNDDEGKAQRELGDLRGRPE